MASIEPRTNKDGSISYRITVSLGRDADGKKIFKKTTFTPTAKAPTKIEAEVKRFAVMFENQVLSGDVVISEKATFSDMVDIWEKNWLPAKTPSVRENYKDVLRLRVLPHIGHMKLTAIRATNIDKIIKDEQDAGLAPKTVRMTFTVINSVFRYALKKQYVRENPCLRCDDLPPVTMKKGDDIQFFTPDQAKRFINDALVREYSFKFGARHRINKATGEKYEVKAYTEKHAIPLQWRVYFTMAIMTMFRRGEMCALTWADFDEAAGTLTVNKALAGVKEGQYLKGPKTEAGIRTVYIPDELTKLLIMLKGEQLLQCMKMGTAWRGHRTEKRPDGSTDSFDNNTIFIQENGLPVHLATPGHKFGEILDLYNAAVEEENRLPKIRLHDLRHTGATLLLGQNVDIETVSKRLGHAKPSVTLDIYGHALPENDKKASDLIGSMLG